MNESREGKKGDENDKRREEKRRDKEKFGWMDENNEMKMNECFHLVYVIITEKPSLSDRG